MGVLKVEDIACFNPFGMDAFKCPNCGSDVFYELKPYGGVWCDGCNASFLVEPTCDGKSKVSITVLTDDCWYERHRNKADRYGTVIWEGDTSISWMAFKDGEVLDISAVTTDETGVTRTIFDEGKEEDSDSEQIGTPDLGKPSLFSD